MKMNLYSLKLWIVLTTIVLLDSCSMIQDRNSSISSDSVIDKDNSSEEYHAPSIKITGEKFVVKCSKERDLSTSSRDTTTWNASNSVFYFDFENKSIDFDHVIKFDLVSDDNKKDADGVVKGRILGMKQQGATFPGYGIGIIELGEGNVNIVFTDITGGKTEYLGQLSSNLDNANGSVSSSNKENSESSISADMDQDARKMAHLSLLVEQEGQLAATTGTKELEQKFKEDNNKVKVLLDKWKEQKVEFYQLCEKYRHEIQNQ